MRPLASVREHVMLDDAEDGQIEHRHDLQDKSVVDSIPTHTERGAAWRGAARRGARFQNYYTISWYQLKYH